MIPLKMPLPYNQGIDISSRQKLPFITREVYLISTESLCRQKSREGLRFFPNAGGTLVSR